MISQSSVNTRARVFLKIELDGLTLRYSDHDMYAKDTDGNYYFWEARIKSLGNVTAGFNDFKEAAETTSAVTISLFNGKRADPEDTLDDLVSDYFWGGKTATIFVAEPTEIQEANTMDTGYLTVGPDVTMGPDVFMGDYSLTPYFAHSEYVLADADIIFKGKISFPNVFSLYSDTELEFSIYDDRYLSETLLNPNIYQTGIVETDTTYPYIRDTDVSKQIPVIYGDHSNLPIAYAAMTDTSENLSTTFKVADTAGLAAGQAPVSYIDLDCLVDDGVIKIYSVDETTATLVIFTKYLQPDSRVYARVKGKTRGTNIASNFGGSSSDLLEHPVEVLYDLLSNYLGVPDSRIDLDSFTDFQDANPDLVCKAYFDKPVSIAEIIPSLTFEFGMDLFSLGEKFYLSTLTFAAPTSVTQITEDDFAPESFKVSVDPNRMYANKVSVLFDPFYQEDQFTNGLELIHSQKRSFHGIETNLQYQCVWNHEDDQIVNRFGRLLYIASLPPRQVNFKGMAPCFARRPNDVLEVNHFIYSSQNLYLRQISKNLNDFTADVSCWDIGVLDVKDWATALASVPATLSDAQNASHAIYHGDLTITDGFNDELYLAYNGAGSTVVALTPGTYDTPELLAAHISAQLTATAGASVTVTYSRSTGKFTLSAPANFEINWTSFYSASVARCNLGFDETVHLTGTNTYTSTYVCPFDGVNQVSSWD